jgi:hypothetical protein
MSSSHQRAATVTRHAQRRPRTMRTRRGLGALNRASQDGLIGARGVAKAGRLNGSRSERGADHQSPNRRRTRVVGAFPDGQSALNLAAARLRHIAGTAWSAKRYLNVELLKDQQMRGAITA